MASLKVPSTALQRFFRHSRYDLYNFEPEKPLRLAKFYGIGETFNLTILGQPHNLFINAKSILIPLCAAVKKCQSGRPGFLPGTKIN